MIERTLKPNSPEKLAQKLNEVEANGLTINDKQVRVCVAGFVAGTLPDGTPANLVEFDETDEAVPGDIEIVTDVPEGSSEKVGFFTKLHSRGLEPITFANIHVLGDGDQPREIEAVTCRTTDQPAVEAQAGGQAGADKDLISDKALELILESEGMDQPSRWPGGGSGITLGVGYDLGFVNEQEFRRDWGGHLPAEPIDRLVSALGKTGGAARAIASQFKNIKIPREAALAVFKARTIPKFRNLALKAFPGMEKLPADAQGSLISLIFNRGPAVEGERRREMKNIRNLIARFKDDVPTRPLQEKIANEIIAMKRLWRGKGLDGLLVRRDAEAKLVRIA